jgi:histidinol-phosphate/aromatic aminotransferase/cobyric acid decarboxylase-like protein/GNAT superfamily N-acetyltransferase
MQTRPQRITLTLADAHDRELIYAIRHDVYARELRQHQKNAAGRLTDALDDVNVYLVAKCAGEIAGFVSVTPPSDRGYSLDKYFARDGLPLVFDRTLYEVRLLTVVDAHRGAQLASLLMYAALRYAESRGARTLAAIGRLEVLDMYKRAGLQSLGLRASCGEVTYELLSADIGVLRAHLANFEGLISRFERLVDWQLSGVPFRRTGACYHGGAFFDAVGEDFETLERADAVINADVLDAWFDPAPAVVEKVASYLAFALKTSPPTGCDGMRRAIAHARGVPDETILPGAGSSDLIFAGLKHWVPRDARVLILDPMYGEYAHVLEKVIGVRVERLTLSKARGYDVDIDEFTARVTRGYDWIVLVNPNSPTGRHIPRNDLERLVGHAPAATRWWIDETYVDYLGPGRSLEPYASSSTNVVVCKSMSKAYALSGVRAAYLCGPAHMMDELRPLCPPWSVSLPGQMAACEALKALDYYRARWEETHGLRVALGEGLLCHLPAHAPEAAALVERARTRGLFIRDVANMGTCLDARTLRVAVKDRQTNLAMLQVLGTTLAEMARERSRVAA